MDDRMQKKVAQAMFKQDHDEPWAQGETRTKLIYLNNTDAALETCHFEKLVEALERVEKWAKAGPPIEYNNVHYIKTRAVLAKVKDEADG